MSSDMVEYTRLSPNHSGKRTRAIDRITPHCVVGQLDAVTLGEWFSRTSTQASCNYAIDRDGRVALIVDEDNRSWCSSSSKNDQRAVTIECASDLTSPYAFRENVYNVLVDLCVDICNRRGKTKLLWINDRDKALNYELKSDEMLLTVHRWFSATDCPGDWMMAHMKDLAEKVTARLNGTVLAEKTNQQAVKELSDLAKSDPRILASLTTAQAILESAYGRSELAINANNLFGMKTSLSGNKWPGSTWDGVSVYSKVTTEVENGKTHEVQADFRRYPDLESSVKDHAAYLIGSGRYPGIQEASFGEACQILLAGGYATDPGYPAKLRSLYDTWNLGALDGEETKKAEATPTPFMVRVTISDLRIRTGPGTQYDYTSYIQPGVYTIVETSGNWGRLKSGAGWICLDYAARL